MPSGARRPGPHPEGPRIDRIVPARFLRGSENSIAAIALVAMVALPLGEALARFFFGVGIPGSGPFVQHLTLWIAFLGAALAAREGKLLALATGEFLPAGRWRDAARIVAGAVGAAASACARPRPVLQPFW